jgi:eukaryotic-like serine/threonine-protein kinase
MTPSTTTACPKCQQPVTAGSKFCASCGNDISGVWGPGGAVDPALGGTIAVEMDPNVDLLGQLLSEATLGDYDVYGELGRGGMAAVYLGLDLALNRKVAIKTMLPELVTKEGMVSRFKREAQTAASLSHPHIIQIYSVKQSEKLVYFVMKFIEGRSLESVITDKGQVPLEMAQVILSQVGSALAFAHRKGVVHRDIKPANIMIDEDGWAIVTDFGIAKVQEAQNLTATGTAIGTPHYMSPEQFHNKAITGASDQYSLGVVAYEMLAGKKPFDGGTYAEIITQHLFEPPPDLRDARPDIPEYVVDVVKKMMAKDPAERFADCEAAAHALGHPPTKQSGDAVRTQMISLAKSGPQKKLRMSVPMSPIPVGKKPSAPAATAIEQTPRSARAGAKAAAAEAKGANGNGWASPPPCSCSAAARATTSAS